MVVEFIERLLGAIIVLGAAIVIVPSVVLPMIVQNQGQNGPYVTLLFMLGVGIIFVGALIYIFREKQYS